MSDSDGDELPPEAVPEPGVVGDVAEARGLCVFFFCKGEREEKKGRERVRKRRKSS